MATLKVTNIKNESFAGDQLYLKSNGYLGIGTTNPGEELEVSADAPSIQLLSTNASGRKYGFQSMNDGKFGIYDGTAGANRIVLASDGKIGIGTSSPSSIFHVRPLDETNFLVRNEGSTVVLASETNSGRDNNRGMALEATAFEFIEGGSEKMRIDSTGRVLIGTTNVGATGVDDLIVNVASGNGGISIRTGAANNGNLYFSDGTSGSSEYKGYLQYRHGTDILVLGAAATEKGWVTSEGLVAFSGNGAGAATGYALKVMGGTNNRTAPGIYMEGSTGADNSSIWAKYNLTLGCDSTDGIAGRQVAFSNGGDQIAAFSIDGLVFGSDSAAANALDDYEEGTWTPTVNANITLNTTYDDWSYTKIGRQVTIRGLFLVSAVSGTNNITCSLPFASADLGSTTNAGGVATMASTVAGATAGVASYIGNGSSEMRFYGMTESGAWFRVANDDITTGTTEIYFAHTYFTAT